MSAPRRVLVVQPYGIGDLLFVTPVLRALRLIPSVESVDLLLGSRNAAAVRANPHVDAIIEIDKDRFRTQGRWKTFREVLGLGKKLREKRYDLLLDYSLRAEYAFLGQFFLGIPERAGFHYKRRGFFHNHRLAIPQGFEGRHVADACCDLAELAGIPVRDRWLEFYADPASPARVSGLFLEGFGRADGVRAAAVSAGGGESWGKDASFKRWAPEKFAAFTDRVCRRLGLGAAVFVGGAGEKDISASASALMKTPVLNLTGKLSLSDSSVVIDRAAVFIGNDGGLLHLACARRKPVIGFYGPVDPRVYGPYPASPLSAAVFKKDLECRPCYRKFRYNSACEDRACLTSLEAAEAYQALEQGGYFDRLEKALGPAAGLGYNPVP